VSRSAIRELIRRAQKAELGGQSYQAVELLEEAASQALEQSDPGRAAWLLRHCLRLAPSALISPSASSGFPATQRLPSEPSTSLHWLDRRGSAVCIIRQMAKGAALRSWLPES
jgi:hypothetical protein